MKVIDASSLAKYVHREEGWEEVRQYLLEGCISIELAVKEVANSIWKRVRRGGLTREQGMRLYRAFRENLMVRLHPQEELYDMAFEIALDSGITIYDALYIALSRKTGYTLVTSDKTQAEAAKKSDVETILI